MLKNSADAAQLDGIRVILSVYQWGAKTTPVTPKARAQYAAFCASLAKQLPNVRDFIVGNEPNLNRFWWPQFGPTGDRRRRPRLRAAPGAELRRAQGRSTRR